MPPGWATSVRAPGTMASSVSTCRAAGSPVAAPASASAAATAKKGKPRAICGVLSAVRRSPFKRAPEVSTSGAAARTFSAPQRQKCEARTRRVRAQSGEQRVTREQAVEANGLLVWVLCWEGAEAVGPPRKQHIGRGERAQGLATGMRSSCPPGGALLDDRGVRLSPPGRDGPFLAATMPASTASPRHMCTATHSVYVYARGQYSGNARL